MSQFNEQLIISANDLTPTTQQMRRKLEQETLNLMLPDETVADWMNKNDENMDKFRRFQDELKEDKRSINVHLTGSGDTEKVKRLRCSQKLS